jgi:hypothetical protein
MCTFPDWCEGDVRLIYDHIDDMPSAQPETHDKRTKTHACDCIDRQSAVDALLDELMMKPERYEDGLDRHDIEAVLGALPPAQPEIIRCKDCKHYYFADNRVEAEQCYVCGYLDFDSFDSPSPNDFCSFAERRTDE